MQLHKIEMKMNLTQKLALTTLGAALSLIMLKAKSAQAAIITYNIDGPNPSGYFSFDDSNIFQNFGSTFLTPLTDFNFHIDDETYTLRNVTSFGGPFDQAGVYFNSSRNPNTGSFQPDLSRVGLSALATKDNTSVLITTPGSGFAVDASNYQFFINSQPVASGMIVYQQQVPEPDFAAGSAAGLGILALGCLKQKRLRTIRKKLSSDSICQ